MDLASDLIILIWSICIELFYLFLIINYTHTILIHWGPLPFGLNFKCLTWKKHKIGVLHESPNYFCLNHTNMYGTRVESNINHSKAKSLEPKRLHKLDVKLIEALDANDASASGHRWNWNPQRLLHSISIPTNRLKALQRTGFIGPNLNSFHFSSNEFWICIIYNQV